METKYPRHLPDFSYVGCYRYFLTFCTNQRDPTFRDDAIVHMVLEQLLRAAREQGFEVTAYCFMPDHLHLLVTGSQDDSDCLRFIKAFKQYSGYHYKQERGRTLWQRYGYEHMLRAEEDTMSVARYILENPVRAGLVEQVEDYPFVGSQMFDVRTLLASVDRNCFE